MQSIINAASPSLSSVGKSGLTVRGMARVSPVVGERIRLPVGAAVRKSDHGLAASHDVSRPRATIVQRG